MVFSFHDMFLPLSSQILKDDIFHPSYGDRPTHRDVVLMVVAGASEMNVHLVAAEAERLRMAGIFINVVAVGSIHDVSDILNLIADPLILCFVLTIVLLLD